MKIQLYILILAVGLAVEGVALSSAKAQVDTLHWKLSSEFQTMADIHYLDPLNAVYTIRNGEVVKWSERGVEVARYSAKSFGPSPKLDVSNPMKVLLFSSEQLKLVFLDSRLGELQPAINLGELGYAQISLVATSHTNGFWVYDPLTFTLIRHSQTLEPLQRPLNLAQMFRQEFKPIDMVEVNQRLYIADPALGVLEFDVLGNYVRTLPIYNLTRLCIVNSTIYYQVPKGVQALNLDSFEAKFILIGTEAVAPIFAANRERMTALKDGILRIYVLD